MTDTPRPDPAKLAASRTAIKLVRDGMRVGLGTGSTAAIMVRELAAMVQADGLNLRCAATSKGTAELAESLGLKIESLEDIGWLDLTIDGADEIDPELNLIKGGGGAHLREKVVASASDKMVVIADPGKVVDGLGAFDLPVEVLIFGYEATCEMIRRRMEHLGLEGRELRLRQRDGAAFVSDEGNYIIDISMKTIPDPKAIADALTSIPGVVEHGLFLGLCDLAIIGHPDGTTTELTRKSEEQS